jgi:hypothetical protein
MKNAFIRKLVFALAALLLLGSTASAKDMGGRFGVGFAQNLTSNVTGLGINYWAGHLKIGGSLGFDLFSPKEGDMQSNLDFAIHALYAIARAQNVNLNAGVRFLLGFQDPGAGDSITGFGFEIPLEVEYFFDDHFAITGHVGLAINIIGEDGSPLSGRGEGFEIGFGQGGFSGGVGFNMYF